MKQAKTLLIVSHVPSEKTRLLTDAVARGASHPDIEGIRVVVTEPLKTGPGEVLQCDGILLGTTENFGYMSGAMKDFFDRIYYPCLEHTEGLPYGIFIRAGLDGTGTRKSMQKIIGGLKWKPVQDPLIALGEFRQGYVDECEELGMLMAAGMESGIF